LKINFILRLQTTRSRLSSPKKLFQLSPSKSTSPSIVKSPSNRSDTNEFSNFKSQGCVTLTAYSLIPDHHNLDISRMDDVNASPFVWTNNYRQLLKKCGDHYVHHVEDSKPFKLSSVIYNSSLKGVFMMAIRSEIAFEKNEMSGFLNVGEVRTDSIVWNRRWCRIDGLNVLFYNDPQELDVTEPPILNIDLTKCIAEKIDMADRSVCARPRTFAIELFDKHHLNLSSFLDNNTKTFLLSADKNVELNMWLVELNKTLQFVRDWKV
jgi:PH domain